MKNQRPSFKNFLSKSFERYQREPVPQTESSWRQLLDRYCDGIQGAFEHVDDAEKEIPIKAALFASRQIWMAAGAGWVAVAVALSI